MAPPDRPPSTTPVDMRRVVRLWWPLAASWLLMGVELPLVTAVVARLADPEVNLAAYGSIVFPVALVVEAPIIMLLAASTRLCSDWDSYVKVRRFMWIAGAVLTALHAAIAFTPLYDVVARDWIQAPEEVVGAARLGLQLFLPWTWAIAYRRFQQGVLIRFEHSRPVTTGTGVRLVANALTLVLGVTLGRELLSGVAVAALAVSAGVTAEAIFIGWSVQPVLRERLKPAPPAPELLTRSSFLRFYVPLALTPLMGLIIQPIGAAAMARMPVALLSLAAWPGVHGLVFLTRSAPMAYNEVVVSLYGERGGPEVLRRFTWILAGVTSGILVLLAVTPLGALWFGGISGLEPELVALSSTALLFAVLMPAYTTYMSWYTGQLVHGSRTRGITEAVGLYGLVAAALFVVGIELQEFTGIYFALAAFTAGGLTQCLWLRRRARQVGLES